MERTYDVSETVVKSIVDNMEYDSIDEAEDQLKAMSELGVLYQEEFDAILEQLKDKEKHDGISEDVPDDILIKNVDDYSLGVESSKKKAGETFTCDECGKTFPIENLGIYTPENVLFGGDSTERIELCKKCLQEFISKTSVKHAPGICSKLDLKEVNVVRKKEGYYLRYTGNEIGPFCVNGNIGLLEKHAVVQKCKEKDKDTAADVYCVYAESGRLMGRYKTKEEAEDRLKQIEMFKHLKSK